MPCCDHRLRQPIPTRRGELQHGLHFTHRKGQERTPQYRERPRQLQRNIDNRRHTLLVGLNHLPRLTIRQILITKARQLHILLQRIAETIRLYRLCDRLPLTEDLPQQLLLLRI